jgi:hypothetical protein
MTKEISPYETRQVHYIHKHWIMKITHTFLFLSFCFFCTSLFSQQCSNDSLLLIQPGDVSYTQPGFIDPNLLPCLSSGNYSELIIPFNTYNQGARSLTMADSSMVPVSHVYSMKIESISNLPSGLCWITRPSNQTITGSQMGLLIIKGTTASAAGTYPLSVSVSLDTQGSGSFNYTGQLPFNYAAILGQVVLKVMGTDNICPVVTY